MIILAESVGLTQLHPGVFSTITSDQTTYDTATGVMTMFVADVFDKGPDGKIEFVSTPSEFMFKYGEPNYSKYGQSAYNVINFLEAGGQAYVMRVLPVDATYAHSILNIQTRVVVGDKKVAIDNFKSVNVDDVHIRPTVSLVRRNNLTQEMLESELIKDRSDETTVDGYDNNFLMLVTPNGRGESYNNLGYRLTPNDSFTSMRNSRVYNFEVVQFNEAENVSTLIEGPFYVSFDPELLSDNQESMFIEEVINRQSEFLNVKVNLNILESVAKQINPEVKSTLIDIVTGGSFDSESTLRFNSITQREEDIHLSLHKYNSAGYPVSLNGSPVINTPEPTDPVQASLVSLDNGLRENTFIQANNKLQYMKESFPTLSSDSLVEFKDFTDRIYSSAEVGSLPALISAEFDTAKPESLYARFLNAVDVYEAENSEENYNDLNSLISNISELYRTSILDLANKLSAAYTLVEHNSPNAGVTAKFNSDVSFILDLLSRKDQINIFSTEHRSLIYDIQRTIFQYQLGNAGGSTLDGLNHILSSVENELNFVYDDLASIAYINTAIPEEIRLKFTESRKENPDSLMVQYLDALQLTSDIHDGIQANNNTNREKIFSVANLICNELLELISEISTEANVNYMKQVVVTGSTNILADADEFVSAISAMVQVDSTYTEHALRENARQQIQIEISKVNNMGSKFFNTNLIDFTNSIKLLLGSDGSFEYQALSNNVERNESIRKELIKAYSGAINTDVLNTDLIRFNVIFDARYNNDVKKAITDLARNVRRDFIFFANDAGTNYTVTPEDSLDWRRRDFNIASEFVTIHGQDLTYFDEYTGRDIRFTPTYVLASKLPQLATQHGLHYPLAGTRRGVIDGFKSISWTPDSAYREKLYKAKVNYIQQDSKATRFNSQLTTINSTGAASYVNNMFTTLEIKRGAEDLLVGYQFEFNDDETISTLYTELNNYLSRFTSNRSCESITSDVSSSDYDRAQRILRVSISIKFTGVIERIVLNLDVKK